MRRAAAGDRDALRFLYVRFAEPVRRYVTKLVGDPELAQDVTQTTFLKLLTQLDRYEERGRPFDAWLFRVARNVALDELRRARPVPLGDSIEGHAGEVSGARADQARRFADALSELPSAQREVILLRYVVGLSDDEIASRVGRTPVSVHNLHYRGRTRLCAALRDGAATWREAERVPAPDSNRTPARPRRVRARVARIEARET